MKKLLCIVLLAAVCFSSTSCLARDKNQEEDRIRSSIEDENENEQTDSSDVSSKDPVKQPNGDLVFEKDFGTYRIPVGWIESKIRSTDEIFYYISVDKNDKNHTDISVRYGTNKYSEDEVKDFKKDAMEQVLTQVPDDSYDYMVCTDTRTQNDCLLVTIEFTGLKENPNATYFYIVGDYKYCEVALTCKDDPEAEQAAQMIIDSFAWAED